MFITAFTGSNEDAETYGVKNQRSGTTAGPRQLPARLPAPAGVRQGPDGLLYVMTEEDAAALLRIEPAE